MRDWPARTLTGGIAAALLLVIIKGVNDILQTQTQKQRELVGSIRLGGVQTCQPECAALRGMYDSPLTPCASASPRDSALPTDKHAHKVFRISLCVIYKFGRGVSYSSEGESHAPVIQTSNSSSPIVMCPGTSCSAPSQRMSKQSSRNSLVVCAHGRIGGQFQAPPYIACCRLP